MHEHRLLALTGVHVKLIDVGITTGQIHFFLLGFGSPVAAPDMLLYEEVIRDVGLYSAFRLLPASVLHCLQGLLVDCVVLFQLAAL